jgi:hypothetical protein
MVELLADALKRDLLPSGGGVAGGASLREAAVVRILVAVGTQIKGNADVLRFAIGTVGVALGALHLGVKARQRITCLAVVELADVDLFPVDEVVTGLAGWPETSLVEILVARNAGGGEAKEGAVQVLVLDGNAFLWRNVGGVVALIALQSGVLALENVSRFVMIEGFRIPLNEREIFAVVFRVAAGALLTGPGRDVVGGMKPVMSVQAVGDFSMAFEALESGLAAEFVTTRAVRGSVEGLVRPRERARRNLGSTDG